MSLIVFLRFYTFFMDIQPQIIGKTTAQSGRKLKVIVAVQVSDTLTVTVEPKDAHTVYTNTRSCPPASQKLYFRVPLI